MEFTPESPDNAIRIEVFLRPELQTLANNCKPPNYLPLCLPVAKNTNRQAYPLFSSPFSCILWRRVPYLFHCEGSLLPYSVGHI